MDSEPNAAAGAVSFRGPATKGLTPGHVAPPSRLTDDFTSYVPPPLSLQNSPRVDPRATRESRPDREAWNVPMTCAGEDVPVAGFTETCAITVTPAIRSTHATWASPFARTRATSEAVALNARRPRPPRTTFPASARVTSRTWLGPETSRWTYPMRRCPLSAPTEAESPGPTAAAEPHVTPSSALPRT